MNYQEYVNTTPIHVLFGIVIGMYFFFRALHLLNKRIINNITNRRNIQKFLYFTEFFAWLTVTLEAIKYFYAGSTIVSIALSVILIIVTAWTAWFVIKDYVAGLYIKWNDLYALGDEIQMDNKQGKIIEMKSRFAVVELDPLHTLQISYSKLFTKNIIKIGLTGLSSNISFTINLSDKLRPIESIDKIKTYIYQLPWINFKHEPIILVEEKNNEGALIRINASLIDLNYSEEFKNNIKNKFE